ncbi:Ell-associated factor Eaf [Nymphon striatum]|nr:Ell-associated factor Eaf [Nymphon striatum]
MKKGDLLGVSWDDRAQVRFLSTNASSGTTNVAVRHSRHGEHRKVPNVAIIYNGGMRGVDCNDQLVDQYASELKTNKLWHDFKPASVDPTQMAAVDIGDNNEVRVTVPHIESSGTNATVFQGSKKPYQKECVLIIDHATGSITLEKLDSNIQLKKTRAEGGNRKYMQRPVTPVEHSKGPGSRFSPSQKFTPSPNEMSRISPNTNSSPAETYSPHQPSPVQSSPSMPVLVPPANSSSSFHLKKPSPPVKVANSMPTFSQLVNDTQNNIEEIGILSDSSDSDMDSVKSNKLWSHPVNRSEAPGAMINLLGKDLELSETESESDG